MKSERAISGRELDAALRTFSLEWTEQDQHQETTGKPPSFYEMTIMKEHRDVGSALSTSFDSIEAEYCGLPEDDQL